MFNRLKFWDIVIIIASLICALAIFFIFASSGGDSVEITVDGELYGTYPLYEDKKIEVITDEGALCFTIEKQKVYVTDSECKDKECIKQQYISRKGQTIVCLPLKVIMKIGGNKYDYAY